jgi:hypothetical protein
MNFDSGTAYPDSDADDEYDGTIADTSPVMDDPCPYDSELPSSNEHTPTTYGHRTTADRLPETIISEWTAEECADFIGSVGLQQYADVFLGWSPISPPSSCLAPMMRAELYAIRHCMSWNPHR